MNDKITPRDVHATWHISDDQLRSDIADSYLELVLHERAADGHHAEAELRRRADNPQAIMSYMQAIAYEQNAREVQALIDKLEAIQDARNEQPQRTTYHVIYTTKQGTQEINLVCPSRAAAEAWAESKAASHWEVAIVDAFLQPGTQVIYVPPHVLNGDTTNPDCVAGFVTTTHPNGKAVWCRFWLKHAPPGTLRNASTGELVSIDKLIITDTVDQALVDQVLGTLEQL